MKMPTNKYTPVLALLIAIACAVSESSRNRVPRDDISTPCSGSGLTMTSTDNDTLVSLYQRAGADLATWPLACIANGLESLDECLFPAPGMTFDIPCVDTSDQPVDQDDWAAVTNATTLNELVSEIDNALKARIASGFPVDRAQEVRTSCARMHHCFTNDHSLSRPSHGRCRPPWE